MKHSLTEEKWMGHQPALAYLDRLLLPVSEQMQARCRFRQ